MKCSLGISNFLEEISSLSHSVVFLYFFALIAEEGFLISPGYSLELCINWKYLSFSPLLFTSLHFTAVCKASSDNHGLEEAQAGIKIAGRNINNLIYTDDTTLVAESEEELKSLLLKVKEESEKVGLA